MCKKTGWTWKHWDFDPLCPKISPRTLVIGAVDFTTLPITFELNDLEVV